MADKLSIDATMRQINAATKFAAVFGTLPPGDAITKKQFIRKQFGYLAKIVHPDHVSDTDRTRATSAFARLNQLRKLAEEAIERRTYDEPIPTNSGSPNGENLDLTSPKGTYRIKDAIFREGDFSFIYRGSKVGATPVSIFAKIARDPTDNSWLEREAVILKKVSEASTRSPLIGIRRFMPNLLDTFLVSGEKNTRYRTNVYTAGSDMVSITEIIAAYPNGLEAPQVAWIARRIIAQTLAAQMLGVTHCAITPDHVLVDPFTHEPLHIGWAHALEKGRITHVVDRWRDIYPKEVFAKKDADHRTDIYMAAATIVKLLGGNVTARKLSRTVPDKIARILLRCLEDNPAHRPQDGALLLDEFTREVRAEWGREYRQLIMPIK